MLFFSLRRTSPLGAACALLLALSGCHDGKGTSSAQPLPEVGVATVAPRTIRLADEFNGRVEAVDAVELRPRVSGYLQRVAYKEGDVVAQGALLLRIRPVERNPVRARIDLEQQ
ncbi:biotin/lipoyl-binding protein, partial [Burkholderia orbicola]